MLNDNEAHIVRIMNGTKKRAKGLKATCRSTDPDNVVIPLRWSRLQRRLPDTGFRIFFLQLLFLGSLLPFQAESLSIPSSH
jgi:hypothetical protein